MTANKKNLFFLLAILLLAIAGVLAVRHAGRGPEGSSPPGPSRRPPGTPQEKPAPSTSANANIVEISGLGSLPYAKELKCMDLVDVFIRCGFARPRMLRGWENGRPPPSADVYLNDKGEIVHISFNKGKYKTKSRAAEAIANFEHAAPGESDGLSIVRFGIPGLTLENTEMLKSFLQPTLINNIVPPDGERVEIELTPVVVEVTADCPCEPKYFGRQFPMFLERYSSGWRGEWYGDFRPEETVRFDWRLSPFLPDPQDPKKWTPQIPGSATYSEPLLEAWEHRERNKPDPKPPPRARRENHSPRR